jgi:hypothetical protein
VTVLSQQRPSRRGWGHEPDASEQLTLLARVAPTLAADAGLAKEDQ